MECPICMDNFESSAFSLACGHLFHRGCITSLPPTRRGHLECPICRVPFAPAFNKSSVREVFLPSPPASPVPCSAPSTDGPGSPKQSGPPPPPDTTTTRELTTLRAGNNRLESRVNTLQVLLEDAAAHDSSQLRIILNQRDKLRKQREELAGLREEINRQQQMLFTQRDELVTLRREHATATEDRNAYRRFSMLMEESRNILEDRVLKLEEENKRLRGTASLPHNYRRLGRASGAKE